VHQRPAGVDWHVAEQPFDWPRTADGDAVLHLADLFGDMDVHAGVARQCGDHFGDRLCRHGAQAVQRTADAHRLVLLRAQCLRQAEVGIDIVSEAPLALDQRPSVEAAGHVQHRQQGHADAGVARRGDQCLRHRRRIRVGGAVGRVVQVVELADRRVAGFEHLDIELRGHRMQRRRIEARGHAIHGFAPGPETVGGIGLALGESGHRPLEGMRMQVGNAGDAPGAVPAWPSPSVRRPAMPGIGAVAIFVLHALFQGAVAGIALGYRVEPPRDTRMGTLEIGIMTAVMGLIVMAMVLFDTQERGTPRRDSDGGGADASGESRPERRDWSHSGDADGGNGGDGGD
jgi:hypothetical protein